MVKDSVNRGARPSAASRKAAIASEQHPKGASTGIERGGIEAYLAHHWHSARSSLKRLLAVPFASLLTWLVIAVALALPAGLIVVLDNLSGLTKDLEGSSQFTVYMELNQDDKQVAIIAQEIAARNDVNSVDFIDRNQALEEFKQASGWGDVLVYLDDNPLPSAIVVQPAAVLGVASELDVLVSDLQALPGVESVQVDLQWVNRLRALFSLLERFFLALSALFGMAVVLVIGNTIRLSIESRRDEIVVIKLVGGTDPYVRRPFLYTGFWYGIVGAVMAWIIVNLSLLWLAQPVNDLASLYFSRFGLRGLGFQATTLLFFTGGMLGISGSWLAVRRHLDDIEPS